MADKDNPDLKLTPQSEQSGTKKYRVLTESGIFKNGETFKKGSIIPLTDQQAKNFMNEEVLGEGNANVEPVEEK